MDVRSLRRRRKSQGGVFNCVAPRCSSRNQTRCNPQLLSDAVAPEIFLHVVLWHSRCPLPRKTIQRCCVFAAYTGVFGSYPVVTISSAVHALTLPNDEDRCGFCPSAVLQPVPRSRPISPRPALCDAVIDFCRHLGHGSHRGCVRLVGRTTFDGLQVSRTLAPLFQSVLFMRRSDGTRPPLCLCQFFFSSSLKLRFG